MASFTRKAIMSTFLELVEERPFNKISIKNIVERCGINRNTCYYHFEDIPSLVEAIFKEETDLLLAQQEEFHSFEECLDAAMHFVLKNRRANLNLYTSANRELCERYLQIICHYAVTNYLHTAFQNRPISSDDLEAITLAYEGETFGLLIYWLNAGLNEDFRPKLLRLCQLHEGFAEEMFARAQSSLPS